MRAYCLEQVGGFVDAYNLSFTNDLEPTSLAECGGYQHASDAGQLPVCDTGWGFFNLNLLRATLQAYRDSLEENVAQPTTILRISHPPAPPTTIAAPPVIHERVLRVEWATVGPGKSFQISIGADLLTTTVTNTTSATLDLDKIPDGLHKVTVTVVDGKSAFPLARESLDLAFAPDAPYVAAYDSVTFELRKPSAHLQTVSSAAVGFVNQPDQLSYEYGPTIIQEGGTFYNIFCSPGGFAPSGNDKVTAWDVIRMTTSTDGRNWSEPSIVLEPSTTWDRSSVCDPSLVKFRGTYFLYHTCINTCTDERAPQDGYFQNRICVALADNITGPFRKIGKPVIEDLTCAPGSHNTTCAKEIGAYCVGQPSATVIDGAVVVFYSSIGCASQSLAPCSNHLI
jgi:plastocyanin